MKTYSYWRGDLMLGDSNRIGEYKNDLDDGRCPFCMSKVATIYCKYMKNIDEDIPIGCFHCIEEVDDEEDPEWDRIGEEIDRAYEDARDWALYEAIRKGEY